MSKRPVVIRSAAVAVLAAAASLAFVFPGQDAAGEPAGRAPAAESSPETAVVKAMVGTWDILVSGMTPEPATGTSVIRLVGDRWAVEDVESTMMGAPFVGHSINGYDAERKRFVGLWVDNFSPKVSETVSTWDEATRTLVGDPMDEDVGDGTTRKVVGRFRQVDADRWVFTQSLADDPSSELWTVEYTRRK